MATIELDTKGFTDIQDITQKLEQVVADSGIKNGILCVANPGSTAGITTVEFETGALTDLRLVLERIAPERGRYEHNAIWNDGNGYSHLRSALIGSSKAFPVAGGALALGTWQQVVFADFDNRPRRRALAVVVVGD